MGEEIQEGKVEELPDVAQRVYDRFMFLLEGYYWVDVFEKNILRDVPQTKKQLYLDEYSRFIKRLYQINLELEQETLHSN